MSSDVAIYKVREKYIGRIDEDGNLIAEPGISLVANVFAKENGTWRWMARFATPTEE